MDKVITGIPASKGKAVGKIAFFNEEAPYRSFNESSILCHAACIARELHIPCIVGINSIFDALSEGANVEIIGEAGEVRRV